MATSDPPNPAPTAAEIPFYRSYVGMRNGFDFMGGLQFSLLFALGLREEHTLCDVGCGSLRAGRLLIPYLGAGNYFGIDPQRDVVESGIEHEIGTDLMAMRRPQFDYGDDLGLARFGTSFDFVLAQSVFSHTYRDLATRGLGEIRDTLAPEGLFVGTVFEQFPIVLPRGNNDLPDDGSGFLHQRAVVYTWREWTALLEDAGLVGHRIRWYHHRQTWFVAARAGREDALKHTINRAIPRLRGPGFAGNVKRRVLAKIKPG